MKGKIFIALLLAIMFALPSYADWKKIEHFPRGFDSLVFDESQGVYLTIRDRELWEAKDGVWTKTKTVVPDSLQRFLVYDRNNSSIILIARKNLLHKGNYVNSEYYYIWEYVQGSFVEKGSTKGLKSINDHNISQAFYCDTTNQIVIMSRDRMLHSWNGVKWQLLSEGWTEEGHPVRTLYDKENGRILVVWDTMKWGSGGPKYQTWIFDLESRKWTLGGSQIFTKFDFTVPYFTKFTQDSSRPPMELVAQKKEGTFTNMDQLLKWHGRKWKLIKGSKSNFQYSGATEHQFPVSNSFVVRVVEQNDAFVTWTWNGSEYSIFSLPWCNAESRSRLLYDSSNKSIALVAQQTTYNQKKKVYKHAICTFWWDGKTWSRSNLYSNDSLGKREGHQIVYDNVNGRIVLFGGRYLVTSSWSEDYTLTNYGDTWEFKNNKWTKLADSGPDPRAWASMAMNKRNGTILLFGGSSKVYDNDIYKEGENFGDTWVFDGSGWNMVSNTGPAPQQSALLAYDYGKDCFVLVGKGKETWEFANGTWTMKTDQGIDINLSFGTNSLVYDYSRNAVVLFNSMNSNRIWKWTGSSWQSIKISGKDVSMGYRSTATYDEQNSQIVVFDGAIYNLK